MIAMRMNSTIPLIVLLSVVQIAATGVDEVQALLVNDGSFENGPCGGGSDWTCWSDTACPNWIIDPLADWGVTAYDGNLVAQLGGNCKGELNSNSFCQDIELEGPCLAPVLEWQWMGFVDGDEPGVLTVSIDNENVEYGPIGPVEDTQGVWQSGWAYAIYIYGVFTVCFEFEAGADDSAVLIDYVGKWVSPTPVEDVSFSTVKSRY